MFSVSVTVREIFPVEMCIALTLTFKTANAKREYANWTAICNFLFVSNSSVCAIFRHSRDIHSLNVHNLDLENEPRSNVNMPIEKAHATFCVGNCNVSLSVTVCTIISHETPNIFNSITWPWKLRSKTFTILIKIGERTFFVNVHMCTKTFASRFSRLSPAYISTYRYTKWFIS